MLKSHSSPIFTVYAGLTRFCAGLLHGDEFHLPLWKGGIWGVGGDMYSLPKLKWGWPRAIAMSSPPHLRELTLLTAPDSHRPYPQISTTLADIFKSDQWCVVPQFLIIQPEGL